MTGTRPAADHFLPIARAQLIRRLVAHPALAAHRTGVERVCAALSDLYHVEYHRSAERLKELYAPLDPNAGAQAPAATVAGADAFSAGLRQLLERANYQPITREELAKAFEIESVFHVKLHTEMGDFAELTLYSRGRGRRQEVIRSWFGLRRRVLDVDFLELVALFVRFQPAGHFPAKRLAKLPFKPGTTTLKLFANIPVADLEMLLPNSEVRMRPLDQLVLGVPAVLGSLGILAQLSAAALFVVGLALSLIGLGEAPRSVTQAELVAFGAAIFTVAIFASRQLARFRFRKLQFIKTLAESLYYRNLDNNAGVIHHLADSAQEEEAKEAMLGWAFLLGGGPATAAELDARIEAWLGEELKISADFEVDDALAKLTRYGLVTQTDGRWTALPAEQALASLAQRWQAALGG